MDKAVLKKKWLLLSGASLAVVGFGLSLLGEAIILKQSSASWSEWVPFGTLALVVFNSGLALFGKAVTLRVALDREG